MPARFLQTLRLHWPIATVLGVGLALMLTSLGKDYLWADEGDTAVLAANIVKYGVPRAWDGVTFVDSDKGARLNNNLVMVTNPWLQYYVTAASFLIFGQTAFSARLMFALAGWFTVLLSYRLVIRATGNRHAGFASGAILVFSVPFLLYCRQCRYYALSMLLTVVLIQIFLEMKSRRQSATFALAAIALFHTQPLSAVPVVALGLLTIISRRFATQRRLFWQISPIIAVLTLPWTVFAGSGYAESMAAVRSFAQFVGRIVQYLVECASITPLIGGIALLLITMLRKRTPVDGTDADGQPTNRQGDNIVWVTFSVLVVNAVVIAATQPADSLWRIGIRYTTAMLPLIAMTVGISFARISRDHVAPSLTLLAVIVFTKFGQLTPWIFWGKNVASFDGKEVIEAHLPSNGMERFFNTRQQWAFLSDLFKPNGGTIASLSAFLHEHAESGDKLITNYEWEPLYFHTGLAQALKILPDYPIYSAAKSKGLPDYVFDVDQVRWIVWRPIWDGYQGYFAGQVQEQIAARGGKIERIAQVPETLWENRENVHFRRFNGDQYLFHEPESFPPVSIFRVVWANR